MKTTQFKHETMRTVLGILILFTCLICKGQPRHSGVMVNGQFEGRGTGNGTIAGVEAENVHRAGPVAIVSNAQVTWDKKGYLSRYGRALRLQSKVRYYLPMEGNRIFVQGGAQFGHVHYPDSPTAQDGYTKYAFQPVVGGGAQVGDERGNSIIVGYVYQFKTGLKAFSSSSAVRILDGWTQGHKLTAETAWPIKKGKWLILASASWGHTVYQRNPDIYGIALGAVLHPYNYTEISIGFGRKY